MQIASSLDLAVWVGAGLVIGDQRPNGAAPSGLHPRGWPRCREWTLGPEATEELEVQLAPVCAIRLRTAGP